MRKSLFFFLALFLSFTLYANEKPLSVLIVGAGPAGLGMALEAHANGDAVTIVEKRAEYTRERYLFIREPALRLFEKWQVSIPEMTLFHTSEGTRMGVVYINDLERGLERRVHELGIEKIHGDFKQLNGDKIALVASKSGDLRFHFDLLIGADGAHSRVKEAIKISTNNFGKAWGMASMCFLNRNGLDLSVETVRCKDLYMRRILMGNVSLIFAQNFSPISHISFDEYVAAMREASWYYEAEQTEHESEFIFKDIPVLLEQAQTFSNQELHAIIIGDAAAVASYFQGKGANAAFAEIEIAGEFLKNCHEDEDAAYEKFNNEMKQVTNELIADSKYLFI